ncbi:hypothetical protein [Planctomicrobium sp. SH664]|uniref:hypothetical protein n=1 Tax=Planctomicrobium sp. SH664 TaxID=3448125 RepID=UPI003F5BB674
MKRPTVVFRSDGGQEKDEKAGHYPQGEIGCEALPQPENDEQQSPVEQIIDDQVMDDIPVIQAIKNPCKQLGRQDPVLVVAAPEPAEGKFGRQSHFLKCFPFVEEREINCIPENGVQVCEVQSEEQQIRSCPQEFSEGEHLPSAQRQAARMSRNAGN